jgi:hypothetical protein
LFRADVKKPPIVCPKIRQLGRGGVLENPANGRLTQHHPSPWPAVWLAMTSKGVGDQPPGRGRLRLHKDQDPAQIHNLKNFRCWPFRGFDSISFFRCLV